MLPIAVCQSTNHGLIHRHREQAPSHIGFVLSVIYVPGLMDKQVAHRWRQFRQPSALAQRKLRQAKRRNPHIVQALRAAQLRQVDNRRRFENLRAHAPH